MNGVFLTLEQAKILEMYNKKRSNKGMKYSRKIDCKNNKVVLNDDSEKILDNYVLELEDKLLKLYSKLEKYNDVDPNKCYNVSGEELFEILDIIEDRK